jgi:hypothetical protein
MENYFPEIKKSRRICKLIITYYWILIFNMHIDSWKASTNMKKALALIVTLISLLIITSVLTSSLPQSNYVNIATTVNNSLKQASTETSLSNINKTTNNPETASLHSDYNSTLSTTTSNSANSTKFSTKADTNPQSQLSYSFPDFTNNHQLTGSDTLPPISSVDIYGEENAYASNFNNNDSATPITTASSSVNTLNFTTYTYGGYLIQHPSTNQFFFSFPNNTCQGQIAGSDIVSVNTYIIKKMDFDAIFTAPKISALGFDEMAVFAASDTNTYKGQEFGIRLDLSDGYIYGYNQEPNVNNEGDNFQMLQLALNDGATHHYSIVLLGSEVAFYIDGTDYGHLTFPSQSDYSILPFSIVAVVHRFTDDWDSTGDNMTVENFNLNSQ